MNTIRIFAWIILIITGLVHNLYSQQVIKPVIYKYADDTPMPVLSKEIKQKSYVVFRTNYLDMIMRETIPLSGEIEQPLSAFGTPSEYLPVSFAVRALEDLNNVSVSISPIKSPSGQIISPSLADIRSVRYMLEMGWSRDKRTMISPIFLEKKEKVNISANQTQPFWITIHVPDDAKAGTYTGKVTIIADKKKPTMLDITFEVLPFKLKALPSNYALAMYDRVRDSDDAELLYKFKDLKEHGMTTVGLGASLGCSVSRSGEKIMVDFRGKGDLERTIKAYKATGMTGPFLWLMGDDVFSWAEKEAGGMDKPEFEIYYRGVIQNVIDHAKANNWPPLVIQPEDEAFGHRDVWKQFIRTMEVLRPLVPQILIEADGQNAPDTSGLASTLHLTDVFNYHNGPFLVRGKYDEPGWNKFMSYLKTNGKIMWYYNVDHSGYHPESGRFSYGYELWDTGVDGMFNWLLFKGGRKNPYSGANDPGYNYLYRFLPLGEETGGPTTQWEATREGVDDLKYLYTWKVLAENAKQSGNATLIARVKKMESELQTWLDEIDYSKWDAGPAQGKWSVEDPGNLVFKGKFKMQGVWELDKYNQIRRKVADWIIILSAT